LHIIEEASMKLKATIELWQKGRWCIAKAPELDFVAQGETIEEAKATLVEVISIQFSEMRELGTLEDYLAECGFVIKDDTVEPENEIIGFERQVLQVA
jgi:predicted RNase H-like HicB family nuclease